jgi:hypothetical protein
VSRDPWGRSPREIDEDEDEEATADEVYGGGGQTIIGCQAGGSITQDAGDDDEGPAQTITGCQAGGDIVQSRRGRRRP